jgi:hypothetical protein
MSEALNEDVFLIYCAKYYDNPNCHSTDEFLEDLKRIKYIKKLVTRYVENGELKERLILNHLTILNNVFGPEHTCKILYLKMKSQFEYIKPFLILLNILPKTILNVNDEVSIDTDLIPMDENIVRALREIRNG